ncbi:MAG TPA: Nif3-like dinuclear metal center hexameric protein [Gemmatimonadales bacterium]|nr:Nif3-like dinuclear metal center hexameric protein [Gemmatimonadales bacterium]
MRLEGLVRYCDELLDIQNVRDAPDAWNGLQVANAGDVNRIAAAVDCCAATIRMAGEQGADLLIVHHGLLWGGPGPLVGPQLERVAGLLRHNIALYGSHIPLDCHPELGNAAVIARELGVVTRGRFGTWREQPFGVWGEVDLTREALGDRLATLLGVVPKAMLFGPAVVRRVGIATGAGGALIPQAAAAGLDALITGEGNHHTYFDAEELRINVYYGGHYATETFGVKSLAQHLGTKFALPWVFLDHPTGL